MSMKIGKTLKVKIKEDITTSQDMVTNHIQALILVIKLMKTYILSLEENQLVYQKKY